jgi:hypothetical protein
MYGLLTIILLLCFYSILLLAFLLFLEFSNVLAFLLLLASLTSIAGVPAHVKIPLFTGHGKEWLGVCK